MASKGKEKVVIEDQETNMGQRSVQSLLEKYESTIKGWEETKTRLRGGHKSVKESILNVVEGEESPNTVREDAEKIVDESTVKGNVEGLIEEREWFDDYDNYDDIEFLGADVNDVNEETDRVNQVGCDKGKGIVYTEEDDEDGNLSDEYCNRSADDDSYDDTYVGLSSSSNMEESVDDEFEGSDVDVDPFSDNKEDGSGRESDDGPMQEPNVLQETEAAARRPHFSVGMTFQDKEEVKRATDKYAIMRDVSLKVVRSDKKTYQVVCEEGCPFSLYLFTYGLSIGWQVKSLTYEHKCACVYKNHRAYVTWLDQYFKVQEAPNFKSKDMKNEVQRELKVCVSLHKCKRAKKKIMEEMDGSFKVGPHASGPSGSAPRNNAEQVGPERLSRCGKIHKFTRCKQEGHNKSTCKEPPTANEGRNRRTGRRKSSQTSKQPHDPVNSQTPQQPLDPVNSQTPQQPPDPLNSQTSQQLPEPTQPTQETHNQIGRSQPPPRNSTGRRATTRKIYKSKAYGFGIRYDETTGSSVYNPGLAFEVVIQQGTLDESMHHTADPESRFPIPNERELRRTRGSNSAQAMEGSRLIQFEPHPINAAGPPNLPYQAPGLQWRGHPSVTTSQLLAQTHTQIRRKKLKTNKTT